MQEINLWPQSYERTGFKLISSRSEIYNLTLTSQDFVNTRKLHNAESIDAFDKNAFFRGMIYSLLARSTSYNGQAEIMTRLQERGLNNPEAIAQSNELSSVVTGIIYHNQLAENLRKLTAEWWPAQSTNFIVNLRRDIESGKQGGIKLRDNLDKTCPGFGYKCASLLLRMCGYTDVVPMDRWAIRFTRDVLGARVSQTYDKKKSIHRGNKYTRSPEPAQYRKLEEKFSTFAREINLAPTTLQMLLYVHRTGWNHEPHTFLSTKE